MRGTGPLMVEMSLEELKGLLSKGKLRPSPGIDHLEKWCLRALADEELQVLRLLLNYIVTHAYFPEYMQVISMSLLFKQKGSAFDLKNYRPLSVGNIIPSLAGSWETQRLQKLMCDYKLIPPGQIAAHTGVQPRDLSSFLSILDHLARLLGITIYALKTDAKQGFDKVDPSALRDVIDFYGLPPDLDQFIQASHSNVSISVRTPYGRAESFRVAGLMRQGWAPSPPHYVLYAGMIAHYLHERTSQRDMVVLRSNRPQYNSLSFNAQLHVRHTPAEEEVIKLTSVAAMDDNIIFALTPAALSRANAIAEKGRAAYGGETDYTEASKTSASILGKQPVNPPSHVTVESIEGRTHVVPVLSHLQMLRVDIDDPNQRAATCREIIASSHLPRRGRRFPISVMRRYIEQRLIYRVLALIRLEPLLQVDAKSLDCDIARKLTEYYGTPFQGSATVLTLPISRGGLGFTSIERKNAEIAIEGVERDLNHQNPLYSNTARLLHAIISCHQNGCISPFSSRGWSANHFSRQSTNAGMPRRWILARKVMDKLGLQLPETDVSYLFDRSIPAQHALCASRPGRNLSIEVSSALFLKGRRNMPSHQNELLSELNRPLRDFGYWRPDGSFETQLLAQHAILARIFKQCHLGEITAAKQDLAMPPAARRDLLENWVRRELLSATPQALMPAHAMLSASWASDGSQIPANASLTQARQVTAGISGPFQGRFKLQERAAWVTHGEIFACIAAHLGDELIRWQRAGFGPAQLPLPPSDLFVDLQNIPRHLTNEAQSHSPTYFLWKHARSWYRWLLDIRTRMDLFSPQILWVKGHQDDQQHLPAQLNAAADAQATQAHADGSIVPAWPTWCMNRFTFWHADHGYIESKVSTWVDAYYADAQIDRIEGTDSHDSLTTRLEEQDFLPPESPYLYSSYAYAAQVQWLARSHALPTQKRLFERLAEDKGRPASSKCLFCDAEVEDENHLFLHCPHFHDHRERAKVEIRSAVKKALDSCPPPKTHAEFLLWLYSADRLYALANDSFNDGPLWGNEGKSRYYLGKVLKLSERAQHLSEDANVLQQTIATLSKSIHTTSIHLAARIWGARAKKSSDLYFAAPKPRRKQKKQRADIVVMVVDG